MLWRSQISLLLKTLNCYFLKGVIKFITPFNFYKFKKQKGYDKDFTIGVWPYTIISVALCHSY